MRSDSTVLERTFDWVLDHDGDLYGDEQERLRWYEAIAVVASIQWIGLPWVAAVLLLAGGRPVASTVGILMAALFLPMLIATSYVHRRRVRTVPERWSRKRVVVTVASVVPYVLLGLGFARAYDAPREAGVGGVVGAVVGVAVVALMQRVRGRRSRAGQGGAGLGDADDE